MRQVVVCLAALAAAAVGAADVSDSDWDWIGTDTEIVDVNERVDCHPEAGASQEMCESRGCIWAEDLPEVPWCFYPPGYGYTRVGDVLNTDDGFLIHLERTAESGSMFGDESQSIYVKVSMQTEQRLRIRITDHRKRFEVPLTIPSGGKRPVSPLYEVRFTDSPVWGLQVIRRSSGELVLDTGVPGLVYGEQFLHLPMRLSRDVSVYGWGENEQHSFEHSQMFETWGVFARDQPPDHKANMYGVHPRLTLLDRLGDAAGILFLNSAAQEITVTPAPGLAYRTIGGLIDMYVFMGPEPEAVVQQYTEAVGRYYIPPYWSLGFHLCRYGYNTLENMQAAVDRLDQYNIPHDAQWGDIDVMDRRLDFTIDGVDFGGLPKYVDKLKTLGVRFVTILDPCIATGESNYRPFDLGQELDVWTKKPDGRPVTGRVWPDNPTLFPDYTSERAQLWWRKLIREFYDTIKFDGLWIDMNEPSNFVAGDLNDGCPKVDINYPPYTPAIRIDDVAHGLADKTLCPDAVHAIGRHYDVHNLLGWAQSEPTLRAVRDATGSRGLVLSRSTFVGSGRWVAHWLGDNFSNWNNLRYSIIGMLQFNQFGIPFVGADICGFIGDTTAELCARWQQLGAFYPFSRNHNSIDSVDQDPGVFGDEVARITRESLTARYWLLPHLYTLFYKHSLHGNTVARPLWHEFPTDAQTRPIDDQFLWGSSILVSPVLDEGATTRSLYLPPAARWFRVSKYFTSGVWSEEAAVGRQELPAPLDTIHLHLRGGVILPLQRPANNTEASRRNPFELLAAVDSSQAAAGSLFYDDGDSQDTVENGQYFYAEMWLTSGRLTMTVKQDGLADMQDRLLDRVVVLGVAGPVTEVLVNGRPYSDWQLDSGALKVNNLNLSVNDDFEVTYN